VWARYCANCLCGMRKNKPLVIWHLYMQTTPPLLRTTGDSYYQEELWSILLLRRTLVLRCSSGGARRRCGGGPDLGGCGCGDVVVVLEAGDLDPAGVATASMWRVVLHRVLVGGAWWMVAVACSGTCTTSLSRCILLSSASFSCWSGGEPGESLC
jgi:hypothetical protein